jgi:hypothetical protein
VKLVIDGREYDAQAQPYIGDLRLLKKEFGFGWGTVATRLQALNPDTDPLALLDDDDFLDALVAWMWMARLRAGERDCTREQAGMVDMSQMVWRAEPGDDESPVDDAAPTSARTGSAPGAVPVQVPAVPKKRSTKTSKQPSTAA